MLIAYVCRWLPSPLLGQVDEFNFKRPARERSSPPWWQTAVDQCILAYADLQIATGIGILTAAFSTICTARCLWQRQYSGCLIPDAPWSFIILIFSYLWRGLLLFRPSHRFLKLSCWGNMQGPLQRLLDRIAATLAQDGRKPRRWLILQYKLTLCLYLAVWALFELAQSFVMSLWICGVGLVWGSFKILEPCRTIPSQTLNTEDSWTFGQVLPVLLLLVPILSFFEGYSSKSVPNPPVPCHSIAEITETVQKAQGSSKHNGNKPPVAKEPSSQKGDEDSMLTHPALGHHTYPQAADEISLTIQNKIPATPDEGANPNGGTKNPREPNSSPPWRCDQRIYESRFVVSCFWGSQLGILSLTALFVVFYFELFVPLGVPEFAKLHGTLQTDFGI